MAPSPRYRSRVFNRQVCFFWIFPYFFLLFTQKSFSFHTVTIRYKLQIYAAIIRKNRSTGGCISYRTGTSLYFQSENYLSYSGLGDIFLSFRSKWFQIQLVGWLPSAQLERSIRLEEHHCWERGWTCWPRGTSAKQRCQLNIPCWWTYDVSYTLKLQAKRWLLERRREHKIPSRTIAAVHRRNIFILKDSCALNQVCFLIGCIWNTKRKKVWFTRFHCCRSGVYGSAFRTSQGCEWFLDKWTPSCSSSVSLLLFF